MSHPHCTIRLQANRARNKMPQTPAEYIADMEFIPSCDECWGAQAPCEEHADDFEV